MLNQNEFTKLCSKLNLSEESIKLIQNVRNSPPARRVKSFSGAISGRFPSRKMGVTIQFESHKNELPFIYELEHNKNVLEFYDQPPTFKLEYQGKDGRKIVCNHTADFFVIEKNSIYWVECKTEEHLAKLSIKQPNRYCLNNEETWICPPGTDYASKFGFSYIVQSNENINWTYQRNIEFLDDYYRSENVKISKEAYASIWNTINQKLGITLEEVFDKTANLVSKDDIYQLITSSEILVDLKSNLLTEPEKVPTFVGYESYLAYSNFIITEDSDFSSSNSFLLIEGCRIEWDGKIFEILNVGNNAVSLISQNEELLEIPYAVFEKLLKKGKIKGANLQETNTHREEILNILSRASEKDFEIANDRHRAVLAKLNDEPIPQDIECSDRTLYRWLNSHNFAKRVFGNGYLGLLPKPNLGNRTPKLPPEVNDLVAKHLEESYETLKQKTVTAVWGEINLRCEEKGFTKVSYKAVLRSVKRLLKKKKILKRQGKRAAYQHQEFYLELSLTTPRHGERPFQIAHVDHTELDIEIVDTKTGKVLGRVHLTLLVDAFSRCVLAFYLSFEKPSKLACMMVLRECVRRHGRLPQIIIVDGGKEFAGIYFETLLAMYECTKKTRPPAEPRVGSVLERLFGSTNTRFIYNLEGNTQIMKTVRQVTKSVNPKNLAIWTLPKLHHHLAIWFYEIYNGKLEHPALGRTPSEEFLSGIDKFGQRNTRYIPFDENFKIMTLPPIPRIEVKVSSQKGVRVNYLNYFCDDFRHPEVDGRKVAVRYDPLDAGIVYACVKKRWVKCYSEYYKFFKGRSEKEIKLATELIKKKTGFSNASRSISAIIIAKFLKSAEAEELLLKQRIKDLESRKINDGINKYEKDEQPILENIEADEAEESHNCSTQNVAASEKEEPSAETDNPEPENFTWYGRLS